MNEVKKREQKKCVSCGEMRWVLPYNNDTVCYTCVGNASKKHEEKEERGKVNSPVLFCQDCQSQFKIYDAKHTDGFKNYEDFDNAVRLHEIVPYETNPLLLTRWECNCKNKKPILTVGMPYSNWADGYIEERKKYIEEQNFLDDNE